MNKVRWIIQENLIAEVDLEKLNEACGEIGVSVHQLTVVPFSNELPAIPVDDDIVNIYYGSTTLMYNIYKQMNKPKGLFFDENSFTMENYLSKWGKHMLSSDAKVMTIGELLKADLPADSEWFLRPNDDSKSFAGCVMKFGDVFNWFDKVSKMFDNITLTVDTKILVGPAYNIKKEWRNYIVDGKVVTSSLYQENFKLKKSGSDIPKEMITFVEERCKEYMPHKLFAMDIALCGDDYYIIECGCINSVGLYHSDVKKLVKEITLWVQNN